MSKLQVLIERSGDGLIILHYEFVQHIEDIMSLSEKYGIGGVDHFDLEEVMKVLQVLHFECGQQLGHHAGDFGKLGRGDDQVIHIQQYAVKAFRTFPDDNNE